MTVADTLQSTLNVRDPDVGSWKQPRHPDKEDEDSSTLTVQGLGQRGQQHEEKDGDGEQDEEDHSAASFDQSFFHVQLANSTAANRPGEFYFRLTQDLVLRRDFR